MSITNLNDIKRLATINDQVDVELFAEHLIVQCIKVINDDSKDYGIAELSYRQICQEELEKYFNL